MRNRQLWFQRPGLVVYQTSSTGTLHLSFLNHYVSAAYKEHEVEVFGLERPSSPDHYRGARQGLIFHSADSHLGIPIWIPYVEYVGRLPHPGKSGALVFDNSLRLDRYLN